MKRVVVFLALAAAVCSLRGEPQAQKVMTVKGVGRAAQYREAVNDALNEALGQVQGVSLQTVRDVLTDSVESYSTDKGSVEQTSQRLKQALVAKTAGRIKSFEITKAEYEKDVKLWLVEVVAQVPGPYIIGRDPNNLRRLVVMPFRAAGAEATVYGKKTKPGPYCEEIAKKVNDAITQTRRFTMLNREFDEAILAELSRLNMESSSASDLGRFKQLLVTDYMVIGTLRVFDSPAVTSNPYTGGVNVSDGPFVEIAYRVLLVPTSQQKWSATIRIPYSLAGGTSVDAMMSTALESAADRICSEIIENVYPVKVTGKTQFELILNQGGMNIRVGETLEVFNAGQEVTDVTTGESLGSAEEMIARIRVTRVTPKMSYAQVYEGTDFKAIPVGAIVRRPQGFAVGAAKPVGAESSVKTTENGVIPPWKKK